MGTTKYLVPGTKTLREKDSVKSANSIKPNTVPNLGIPRQRSFCNFIQCKVNFQLAEVILTRDHIDRKIFNVDTFISFCEILQQYDFFWCALKEKIYLFGLHLLRCFLALQNMSVLNALLPLICS